MGMICQFLGGCYGAKSGHVAELNECKDYPGVRVLDVTVYHKLLFQKSLPREQLRRRASWACLPLQPGVYTYIYTILVKVISLTMY